MERGVALPIKPFFGDVEVTHATGQLGIWPSTAECYGRLPRKAD
jgi:hypothetical protein